MVAVISVSGLIHRATTKREDNVNLELTSLLMFTQAPALILCNVSHANRLRPRSRYFLPFRCTPHLQTKVLLHRSSAVNTFISTTTTIIIAASLGYTTWRI